MTQAATVEVSDYVTTVIESAMRFAHRGAFLVGTYLTKIGAVPKSLKRRQLVSPPIELALGLAAILQIWL